MKNDKTDLSHMSFAGLALENVLPTGNRERAVALRLNKSSALLTYLESTDCKFFTDNKVAARTAFPQIWDKPIKTKVSLFIYIREGGGEGYSTRFYAGRLCSKGSLAGNSYAAFALESPLFCDIPS